MRKIFITGDLHGGIDLCKFYPEYFQEGKELTKEDLVIICGDFGLLWGGSIQKQYDKLLDWLDEQPWTTLFLDGNHENFVLLNSFPKEKWNGGYIHKVRESIYHLMRGEIYNIDGETFFVLGGAFSPDYYLREENISWWKEEMISLVESKNAFLNLKKYNNCVDYILTHDCPDHIKKSICPYPPIYYDVKTVYGDKYLNINDELECIYNIVDFKEWYFGHYHQDLKIKGLQCCYNEIYQLR